MVALAHGRGSTPFGSPAPLTPGPHMLSPLSGGQGSPFPHAAGTTKGTTVRGLPPFDPFNQQLFPPRLPEDLLRDMRTGAGGRRDLCADLCARGEVICRHCAEFCGKAADIFAKTEKAAEGASASALCSRAARLCLQHAVFCGRGVELCRDGDSMTLPPDQLADDRLRRSEVARLSALGAAWSMQNLHLCQR